MLSKLALVCVAFLSLPTWASTVDLQNNMLRLNENVDSCQATVRLEATPTEAYMTVSHGLCPLISVNGSSPVPLQTAYRLDLKATYSITLVSAGQPMRHDTFIVKTSTPQKHKKPAWLSIKIQNFNPIEF